MSKKGYKQTEEHKKKNSLAHKDKKMPWLIGNKHAKKGRSGVYKRTSDMKTGKHMLGRKLSANHQKNIGKGLKKAWDDGKRKVIPITKEQRRKMISGNIGKHTGSKCPFWKGGISPLIARCRENFKYKEWRTKVFIRDNYTCCSCHQIGRKLNAHHIKGFAKIFYENKIKTLEQRLNCKELWDINNGVTLCKECHKLTDNFGKGYIKKSMEKTK